jgi:hypothetical protein
VRLRAGLSSLNGYVRLPEGSPDRIFGDAARDADQAGYDLLSDVDVHGGLTYGPDPHGWVGFDTCHAFDWWAIDDLMGIIGEEGMMVARMMQRHEGLGGGPGGRWTMERLVWETDRLAAQLAARCANEQRHP